MAKAGAVLEKAKISRRVVFNLGDLRPQGHGGHLWLPWLFSLVGRGQEAAKQPAMYGTILPSRRRLDLQC
jgi:hypothetical protein